MSHWGVSSRDSQNGLKDWLFVVTTLKLIDDYSEYEDVDFVVVADLDGVNSRLTSDVVASCWSRTNWDVCTANQNGPYYDVWALRHPLWSPNDCWVHAEFLMSCGVSRFRSISSAVYSRMIRLLPNSEWIEVESSFGGLAIYRKIVLNDVSYNGINHIGEECCEHVSLHAQIREKGGRIFINPGMLNSDVVGHAVNATGFGLVCFWLRCQLRSVPSYLRILSFLKRVRVFLKSFYSCSVH